MKDLDEFGTASHEDGLIEQLRDLEFAREYLKAALEEKDPRIFLLALRRVAKSQGGISHLADEAELNRETLLPDPLSQGKPYAINIDSDS